MDVMMGKVSAQKHSGERAQNLESKVSLFNFALFRFKMRTSDKIAKVLPLSQHRREVE